MRRPPDGSLAPVRGNHAFQFGGARGDARARAQHRKACSSADRGEVGLADAHNVVPKEHARWPSRCGSRGGCTGLQFIAYAPRDSVDEPDNVSRVARHAVHVAKHAELVCSQTKNACLEGVQVDRCITDGSGAVLDESRHR